MLHKIYVLHFNDHNEKYLCYDYDKSHETIYFYSCQITGIDKHLIKLSLSHPSTILLIHNFISEHSYCILDYSLDINGVLATKENNLLSDSEIKGHLQVSKISSDQRLELLKDFLMNLPGDIQLPEISFIRNVLCGAPIKLD